MTIKSKTKSLENVNRVSVAVPIKELNDWRLFFQPYGSKTMFAEVTKKSRQTLTNILNTGSGEKASIEAIRNYVLAAKTKAA